MSGASRRGGVERVQVSRGVFFDSVALMLASREARERDGVTEAAAVAATPLNLGLLEQQGFDLDGIAAGPDDLVIAVRAEDEQRLDAALAEIEERLTSRPAAATAAPREPSRSVRAAARAGTAELALVSVPGRHAAWECAAALEAGLHVFCFSDGVPLDHEVALKRFAGGRGLLMLGPECGTALLGGVGIGFANAVRRGPVGLVGASGTGLQALSCLLDAAGVGVSHAIGVGGRDLEDAVGGLMSVRALELLAADRETVAIGVVAKSPGAAATDAVLRAATATGKPTVVVFPRAATPAAAPGIEHAASLEDAAARLARLAGGTPASFGGELTQAPNRGLVMGLFSGGTLCDEAAEAFESAAGRGSVARGPADDGRIGDGTERHLFVDFGAAPLTRGRAHPMIDPSLRALHLERAAADDRVAAVLFDVVLGYAAHPDPAAELAAALERGRSERSTPLAAVVSLCAADGDPQDPRRQAARLEQAGAVVTRSNVRATRLAVEAAGAGAGGA